MDGVKNEDPTKIPTDYSTQMRHNNIKTLMKLELLSGIASNREVYTVSYQVESTNQ